MEDMDLKDVDIDHIEQNADALIRCDECGEQATNIIHFTDGYERPLCTEHMDELFAEEEE